MAIIHLIVKMAEEKLETQIHGGEMHIKGKWKRSFKADVGLFFFGNGKKNQHLEFV